MLRSVVLMMVLVACGGEAPPADPKADAKPADKSGCELTLETLDGKGFVMAKKGPSGKPEEDLMARVRFAKEGDKIKAKYTTRSLSEVYDYTCAVQGPELSCWQDEVKVENFCRALVANNKPCTPDGVAQLTGLKAEAIAAKVEETKKAIDGMSPKDRTDMMALYSSANKPLRGVLHVRVKKDICGVSLGDMFQYMSNGQLKEVENVVGTAPFAPTEKELVWENCADGVNLVYLSAPDAKPQPGDSLKEVSPGQTLTARYVGPEHTKAEAGCTYTMDTFGGYERIMAAAPVAAGPDGALDWTFQYTPAKAGYAVTHMYRYKTCEGKPAERVGVSCQVAKVK